MKEQVDTLVKAWYVVTMNETRDIIKNGAIALKNGLIVELGKFSDLEKNYDAYLVRYSRFGLIKKYRWDFNQTKWIGY